MFATTPIRLLAATAALALWLGAAQPAAAQEPGFEPSEVQRVSVGGEQFAYRTIGSGPPLVLITGFGSTMATWDPHLIAPLAEEHRVIIFDNRGAGDSAGMPVRGLSAASMADDTAAIIRKLAGGRADVLGWSMGGYIAQELALDHPKRVRRLVLAATDPGSPHTAVAKERVLKILSDPDATPEELLPILFPPAHREAGEAWFARLGEWPGLTDSSFVVPPATLRAQTKACGKRWLGQGYGTYSRLRDIRQPTLVSGGAKDVVAPPSNFELLDRRIPDSTLRIIPDAGHAFWVQENERFAALVDGFLG